MPTIDATENRILVGQWFNRANLNERERRMMDMRYGLSDGAEMTFSEIGAAFDLTTERVRQIILRAERRIRTDIGRHRC